MTSRFAVTCNGGSHTRATVLKRQPVSDADESSPPVILNHNLTLIIPALPHRRSDRLCCSIHKGVHSDINLHMQVYILDDFFLLMRVYIITHYQKLLLETFKRRVT